MRQRRVPAVQEPPDALRHGEAAGEEDPRQGGEVRRLMRYPEHSAGGAIAVLVAARRPDLVGALVVLDGNLDPGGGSFSASVAAQSEAAYVASGYHWRRSALQITCEPESILRRP